MQVQAPFFQNFRLRRAFSPMKPWKNLEKKLEFYQREKMSKWTLKTEITGNRAHSDYMKIYKIRVRHIFLDFPISNITLDI